MSHQVKSSNDVIFQHVCSLHQQHVFEKKKCFSSFERDFVHKTQKNWIQTKKKKTEFAPK